MTEAEAMKKANREIVEVALRERNRALDAERQLFEAVRMAQALEAEVRTMMVGICEALGRTVAPEPLRSELLQIVAERSKPPRGVSGLRPLAVAHDNGEGNTAT